MIGISANIDTCHIRMMPTSESRFMSSPVRTQSKKPISCMLSLRNRSFLTRHITRSAAELNSLSEKLHPINLALYSSLIDLALPVFYIAPDWTASLLVCKGYPAWVREGGGEGYQLLIPVATPPIPSSARMVNNIPAHECPSAFCLA